MIEELDDLHSNAFELIEEYLNMTGSNSKLERKLAELDRLLTDIIAHMRRLVNNNPAAGGGSRADDYISQIGGYYLQEIGNPKHLINSR
jgi:hypothetical protein